MVGALDGYVDRYLGVEILRGFLTGHEGEKIEAGPLAEIGNIAQQVGNFLTFRQQDRQGLELLLGCLEFLLVPRQVPGGLFDPVQFRGGSGHLLLQGGDLFGLGFEEEEKEQQGRHQEGGGDNGPFNLRIERAVFLVDEHIEFRFAGTRSHALASCHCLGGSSCFFSSLGAVAVADREKDFRFRSANCFIEELARLTFSM